MQKDSLMVFADSLKNKYSRTELKTNLSYLIAMGLYHAKLARYELSRIMFTEALALVDKQDEYTLGKIYNCLGNAAFNVGQYPKALGLYKKGLGYFEKIDDKRSQAGIHSNLSQLFQLTGDSEQSRTHFKIGLSLLENQKNSASYLLMLHAMANVYGQNNFIDSALLLDKEGLAIARKLQLPEYESMFLDNKANCFMYSNRPDSARKYFGKSYAIDVALGNIKQQSDTWLNLSVLADMEKKPDSAKRFLEKSIALSREAGYKTGEVAALKMLGGIYEQSKQFEQALKIEKSFNAIQDSISSEKKEAAIAEWKAVFETEQKDQQIKLANVLLERKNIIIYGLSAIMILAALAVYYAVKRYQIKKERNYNERIHQREQQAAADLINAEEKERRRIAAELHDGIGQTMTAAWLNLQAIATNPSVETHYIELLDTTTTLVQNSCNEIRSISHHMMPDVLLSKGFIPALKALISNLPQHISIQLSADEKQIKLNNMQELMLYRVVQECLQNTLKHAMATEIDISINVDLVTLSLLIEDNGKGFEVANLGEYNGMGINSISSRVHFLKGTVEWSSCMDTGGTLVAIHIPI
ncbi:tetratricopeptide repeat-containing sensor histidine kinase [Pedobacter agri]|uniref:histidine kinase n=1 Tax=Pedobacter agri TaxID=454586 RepID=A0A9X3DCI0_9SPHI|nr:histidine kinase [Pedobacter agri]MCX3264894.1 histidine kinase [Pedobacter agri]